MFNAIHRFLKGLYHVSQSVVIMRLKLSELFLCLLCVQLNFNYLCWFLIFNVKLNKHPGKMVPDTEGQRVGLAEFSCQVD